MDNGKPVTKLELDAAKDDLMAGMRQIETNLLTEFHRYAKGQNARVHK